MPKLILGALAVLTLGASALSAQARSGMAVVNGVRLNYIDYGGRGTGLVFLPGLGDSPHAYDDIAPAFTGGLHVVSYARRAHGSSQARPPYDMVTMGEDLHQLLVRRGIQRAVLVGWSMGGLEAAELAVRHPGMVAGVVFLDSYDLSDPQYRAVIAKYPTSFDASPAARASPAAFRSWWKANSAPDVPWSRAMHAEVDDLYERLPGGAVRLHVSDSLEAIFIRELMAYHADYAAIKAPVLAFWARPYAAGVGGQMPDSRRAKVERWMTTELIPWQDSTHARFVRALPHARIVLLDHTTHSALPFQRRDVITAELKNFLETLPR